MKNPEAPKVGSGPHGRIAEDRRSGVAGDATMPLASLALSRRTTKQLVEAPTGAIFIYHSNDLRYVRPFAAALGRTDLLIYGPDVLSGDAAPLRARHYPAIVCEHACRLTAKEAAMLYQMRARARSVA